VQHEGRGRVPAAGRLLAPGGHLLLGIVHGGQDLPRPGQEDLAFLGQFQAGGGRSRVVASFCSSRPRLRLMPETVCPAARPRR
jgi:hypothetical protein